MTTATATAIATAMTSTVITNSPPTSVSAEGEEGNDNDSHCCDSIGLTISVSADQHDNDAKMMDGGGGGAPQNSVRNGSDQADLIAALEDRVRDLEEKLSTLSMMLALQPQSPKQDRSVGFVRRSPPVTSTSPSPPGSGGLSIDGTSSSGTSSPPVTFRSLASFATIPSSNVPVLESPTPVMRGNRGRPGFGKPVSPSRYEAPDSPGEPVAGNRPTRKINRNLSYRILHAPDSQLDLTSAFHGGTGNRSDTGSEETEDPNRNHAKATDDDDTPDGSPEMPLRSADDSFEQACRVPTLDSLPGSSRTSPILSKDPAVNMVLSPDTVKDSNGAKKADGMPSPASFAGVTSPNGGVNDNNHDSRSSLRGTLATPPGTVRKSAASTTNSKNSATSAVANGIGAAAVTSESGSVSKAPKKKSNIKSKWLDYLNSVQDTNYDTDKQMEEFVRVPSAVEALLSFGFWISVDSFLYTLTMLPLRFVYSTGLLVIWVLQRLTGRVGSGPFTFHRHNSYHLIQASVIYTICKYVLVPIDVSVLYHWIRSQSMVKLYLLVAIVEVFDRLMCSLGQDCLDSLYWNTTRRPRSSRLIVSALVVLVYTGLHSFLLFVHVATLNVAMNSDDQALLSLLIGGNFAEIKSTVFKKYNKATLFKITASDICERFKLALFLLLVLTLNASQGMDSTMLYNYLSMCWIVYCAEWLSDWLKHAFITKFNYIASGVYAEYGLLLAGDVSGFGHEGENLDVSHAVVKRLGLAQIPLVCVMTKYLKEAYKYQTYENQPRTWVLVAGFLAVWLVLLATKVVLAFFLERMCRNKLEAAPEFSKTNTAVAKKKTH